MVTVAVPQMGSDPFRRYMKSKYGKSLDSAGAKVVWITLEGNPQGVDQALQCDGLLLPGGADVSPGLYGETPEKHCGKPDRLRKEMTTAAGRFQAALEGKTEIL